MNRNRKDTNLKQINTLDLTENGATTEQLQRMCSLESEFSNGGPKRELSLRASKRHSHKELEVNIPFIQNFPKKMTCILHSSIALSVFACFIFFSAPSQ
jgi:adenine deaminase